MNSALLFRLRVVAARVTHAVGWAGLVGVGLMLAALVWMAVVRLSHRLPSPAADLPTLPASSTQAPRAPKVAAVKLPARSELSSLLAQIHQTAVSNGLGWPAADYKVTSATETAPASLEVRCRLKGDYPKLRGAIAQLLRSVPGLTIRDLSMSRANSDAAEIDAKLTMVVFLQDEPSAAERAAQKASP